MAFAPLPVPPIAPQERTFRIEARQFAYSPSELKVNPGDKVTIQLVSTDVVHGLYVDGYGVSVEADPGQTASIDLCCEQARLLSVSLQCHLWRDASLHDRQIDRGHKRLAVSFHWVGCNHTHGCDRNRQTKDVISSWQRLNLPVILSSKEPLKSRYPQLAVFIVMLVGYIFAILAGLVGTPVGSHNFSIVFVWIAWWAILILVAVPFFGRGWCAVCPIPLPGEWLQRGAVLAPPDRKPKWLNLRWPRAFRNIWLQNISFLLLALFSSVLLTTPNITGIVLAAMLFAAIGLSMVFERRCLLSLSLSRSVDLLVCTHKLLRLNCGSKTNKSVPSVKANPVTTAHPQAMAVRGMSSPAG